MTRILCLWFRQQPGKAPALRAGDSGDFVTTQRMFFESEIARIPRTQCGGFSWETLSSRDAINETSACLSAAAQHCLRFSPRVAVERSPEPECLFLDIGGVAHLFGGEAALVEAILADLAACGLATAACGFAMRAAVAGTIGAAWALAHFATRNSKPTALHCEAASGLPPSLRPLPVEALRLSEPTVALLHQLGIRRIEQLEAIPRGELFSRFEPELLEAWDRATGRLAEPLPPYAPPEVFAASWQAEYPTARRETIEAALDHLVHRVADQLGRSGRGAMRLECRLECAGGAPLEVAVGLFQPTGRATHLIQLLHVRFEPMRLPGPVLSIRLSATLTAPLELRQQELFPEGPARRNPRQLAGLIDRLSSRLGPDRVVRPRLVPDAQPELAYRYVPLVGGAVRRRGGSGAAPDRPLRPLRLLTRPVALEKGSERFYTQTWGPERIETGWWRGRPASRDYYRVETSAGRRFWIFRRLHDDRWFLHGVFD